MRVSARVEQSLQALAQLARAYGSGAVPLSQVAEEGRVALPFLEQLMLGLRRNGLVTSVRGVHGGYSLAKDPSRISVGDIMAAVEGPPAPARDVWALVRKKVMDTLNSVTLADLCRPKPMAAGGAVPGDASGGGENTADGHRHPGEDDGYPGPPATVERKKNLRGNSLEAKNGEVRAVMRPNRSGKSSLWWTKACPKCGGDMYRDRLPGEEWELNCLQCGIAVPRAQAQALELTDPHGQGRFS